MNAEHFRRLLKELKNACELDGRDYYEEDYLAFVHPDLLADLKRLKYWRPKFKRSAKARKRKLFRMLKL